MIGDLRDAHLQPVPTPDSLHPKLEELLDLADQLQAVFAGSYVAVHILVDEDDLIVRDGAEISDRRDIYSVMVSKKERLP